MAPASFFFLGGVSSQKPSLWHLFRNERITSQYMPQVLLRPLFPLCVSACCWTAFSLRAAQYLQAFPEPSTVTLKLRALSPTFSRCHEIQPLVLYKPIAMGVRFPCVLPCVLACLSSFSVTVALAPAQQPRSISLPSPVSILPTFFDVASSLPLLWSLFCKGFVSISGVLRLVPLPHQTLGCWYPTGLVFCIYLPLRPLHISLPHSASFPNYVSVFLNCEPLHP